MGDFSEAALEIAVEMSGDLAEQVTDFTYTQIIGGAAHPYRGIASEVKQFETDGESVTMTSTKWYCLKHELPVTPLIDDYLLIDGRKHRIGRVSSADKVVGWYLYTDA